MSVFETKVINIGSEAPMFLEEKMIVLFGENAPDDLADYTYNIELNPVNEPIRPGMDLIIDNDTFKITAVGDVVNKNLADLGHITLKFDGSETPELAGTLYLEEKEAPNMSIDSTIVIQ